jgi:hypothetical protein
VVNGPPSPTVSECAFPAQICEARRTGDDRDVLNLRLTRGAVAKGPASKDDIFNHILPGEIVPDIGQDVCFPDQDEEEENEDDPSDPDDEPGEGGGGEDPEFVVPPPPVQPAWWLSPAFLLPFIFGHPWANNTATATTTTPPPTPVSTATVPFETPIARPTAIVDLSLDTKPHCYNSGLKADRSMLIDSVDDLCLRVERTIASQDRTYVPAGLYQVDRAFKVKGQKYTDYVTTFEIMDFCRWDSFDKNTCGREFRKIVDGCNTKGENGKQGGTMESGDCIKWRVDPNTETA